MRHIVCSTTSEICTSYESYLSSNHWKNVKGHFRASRQYTGRCFICEREKDTRNNVYMAVHHRSYINIGKELDRDLVLLCSTCHPKVHKVARDKKHKFVNICFAVEYLKSEWCMSQLKKKTLKKNLPKSIKLCDPWGD